MLGSVALCGLGANHAGMALLVLGEKQCNDEQGRRRDRGNKGRERLIKQSHSKQMVVRATNM